MARTIRALLVGIDTYPSPVPTLQGCVNDIEVFGSYLAERIDKGQGVALDVRTLKNDEAVRQNVIQGFRDHLGKAVAGDVALFYYSGHGSQEQSPEQFWTLEPDHLDETLVCFDSRQQGSWDLADKELAKLIADVAATGAHVAVILDCCHSGSGTRDITMEETGVRRAPTDLRRRPIESFLVSAQEAIQASTQSRSVGPDAAGVTVPRGRHVLFAACRDNQTAKEYYGDGKHRGAFSYFIGDALRTASAAPTYRDLFARVTALVGSSIQDQSPQLETTQGGDLDTVFLDGAIRSSATAFTASFRDGNWILNGGAAHGIPPVAGDAAATFALFTFDASADDLTDATKVLGTAKVLSVLPATSRIAIEGIAGLKPEMTFKAVVLSLPTPALGVRLEGDDPALGFVRDALAKAGPGGKPSLFVREVSGDQQPEFRLLARGGQYVIAKPSDDRPLVGQIDGLNPAGAKQAVSRLEHIARWTQTARLNNPASTIKPDDVKLTILVNDKAVDGREIRLEYRRDGDQWVAPTFKLSMTNNSKRRLFCALLDLPQTFKVDAGLQDAGCTRLEAGETSWALDGGEISGTVPDALWEQGLIEFKDLLKLIVSTQEFDARLLEQNELDLPKPPSTRDLPSDSSLNRLMRQVQTRDLAKGRPSVIDDWQASELSFTTVRPLEATRVPGAGASVTLAGGIRLEGHPTLQANASLSSVPLSTRDLGDITLPRLLRDDPTVCQALAFSSTRGADPGLSVLELTDVADSSAVTAQTPLRITIPVALDGAEHVLPVAYDGEFFLPLGRVESRSATSTSIVLDRLPPPLVDSRSLSGAIKIFFQKVVSRVAKVDFPYPILGVADVAPDGTVVATGDPFQVRQRVAKAKRIALFVHGITGDTRSMVPCVQLARTAKNQPVASLYDLILTFDYENLNTKIEDNGRALKARLESVGLGAGHGKTLDIVAHSMGGLVSRWFIEREGGNALIRRLIMLGTPNGGSPWPRVFDWATLALAIGLNNLTVIAWPASVLGGLTSLAENPTVALNQMVPGSEALTALAASPDPGIPYVMLAGNTSLVAAATTVADPKKASLIGRLLARVSSPEFLHTVANPFFLSQTNDVAVSTTSMENISMARKPAYDVRPVACDHLSYFRDPAGLKAIATVMEEGA